MKDTRAGTKSPRNLTRDHIRGQERADLVDDLARGTIYTRSWLTSTAGLSRRSDDSQPVMLSEIAGRRRVLHGELASETTHLWVADKTARIAWYQTLIEDLDSYLADDGLDLRVRHRYTTSVASMLRAVAEEKGELFTRATVEVNSGPALHSVVEGWNPDRWRAETLVKQGWIPPSDEASSRSGTTVPLLLSRSVPALLTRLLAR